MAASPSACVRASGRPPPLSMSKTSWPLRANSSATTMPAGPAPTTVMVAFIGLVADVSDVPSQSFGYPNQDPLF